MKRFKLFVPLAFLLCLTGWLSAQTLTQVEYFYDTDPGVGRGTIVTITTPLDSVSMSIPMPIGSLTSGFHFLYLRFKSDSGTWGLSDRQDFFVNSVIDTGAGPKISAGEYFFDTDPGVGNGTALTGFTAADSVSLLQNISVSSLSVGFHHLYVRFRYTDGTWGNEDGRDFYIFPTGTTGASPLISTGEYFFDTDPGVGNGTALPSFTLADSVSVPVPVSVSTLSTGFHHLYVRFQYANGIWGLEDGRDFYVIPAGTTGNSPLITSAEYFFDTDPGVGNGTALPGFTAADSVNVPVSVSVNSLSTGFHHLYIRFQYVGGTWGLYDGRDFYVMPAGVTGASPEINYAEYFFDHDPGVGNGTAVPVNPPTDSTNLLLPLSVGSLDTGIHHLFFRFRYTNGVWGLYQPGGADTFNICNPPVDTITASGPTTFCIGGSVTLRSDTASTWTYQWQLNGVNLAGDTNSTLLVTDSGGIYDVVVTDTVNCPGTSDSITITINAPSSYSYSQSICSGQTYNFNGRSLNTSGTYDDTLTNAGGCDSLITLTLNVTSAIQVSISDSICPGDSFTFNGTTFTQPGTYRDTATSVGGCDSITTLALAFYEVYTTPISGSICVGDSFLFEGVYIYTGGVYTDTLTSINGCDSIVFLTLTEYSPVYDTISGGICPGGTYTFNGVVLDSAGVYTDTLLSSVGCDSIVTLILSANTTSASSVSDTICQGESVTLGDSVLTIAGVYTDTLTNSGGCDSVVTLTLTVLPTSSSSFSDSICLGDTLVFGTSSLTVSGVYTDTLTNAVGCDSVVTLTLTVSGAVVTLSWDSLVRARLLYVIYPGDTVDCIGNQRIALTGGNPAGGTYTGTHVSGDTLYWGDYGLDTITYTVTQNGCTASASDSLSFSVCEGINEVSLEAAISLYPNPANDRITVQSNLFTVNNLTPLLYDVTGRLVTASFTRYADKFEFNTTGIESGVYWIKFTINNMQVSKRFVKVE